MTSEGTPVTHLQGKDKIKHLESFREQKITCFQGEGKYIYMTNILGTQD